MDKKALKNIFNQALTFLAIFLIINFIYNQFFAPKNTDIPKTGIQFSTNKKEYGLNEIVSATVENYTDHAIVVKNPCPAAPVIVQTLQNGQWQTENVGPAKINCADQKDYTIAPAGKQIITLQDWNHLFFSNLGQYKLQLTVDGQTLESPEISVVPQSFFSWIWTILIYQPIYNALILFASILPNHDFGFAIILLTILIRTILLIPNQRALKSQKKLQHIQPKISALKDKHGGDQQKIAQETMAIYKEHKVNPFGSCLPLLIQLPILIGLYNVIQTGINPNNAYLLYGAMQNFDLSSVNTIFFGILDLTKVNIIVLPIIVGLLQFIQLRLSMGRLKKAKTEQKTDKKPASEMEMANKTMTWIMPFMIAFFTASVPSGVGLYWAFSTTYGILQQLVVNRQVIQETTRIKEVKKAKDDQTKS
jgi:YidC/Oxa1 family membrane protein insertase